MKRALFTGGGKTYQRIPLYFLLFTSSDCGSVRNNTLTSPSYPNNYPNDLDCIYRVPIPFDKDLVIYFNYFFLESHWNCW